MPQKSSRIQTENRARIGQAALEIFARDGYGGATIDAIAHAAGMSKPNLLYYFASKDAVYRTVLESLMARWLETLGAFRPDGDPMREIASYIERKIELSRDHPEESRLFASEMLRGAPIIHDVLSGPLRTLVDEAATTLKIWMASGKMQPMDPRHLIFAIWAVTQHYADFDVQVRAVLGNDGEGRFHDAAETAKALFLNGLRPRSD